MSRFGRARRAGAAWRRVFPAALVMAAVGLATAPMSPVSAGRPPARPESVFTAGRGDLRLAPSAEEPPRLRVAFLHGLRPQRPAGGNLLTMPVTGATPTVAAPPPKPWPPGTTADTYRFTALTQTVTDVRSLIDGKDYADRAFDVLDQLGVPDIVNALELLGRQHGDVHALRTSPQAASFPRVAGAAAAVEDPGGFAVPAGAVGPDRDQLEAFVKVRRWPALLPRQAVALDATQAAIADFIRRERSMVPDRALRTVPADDANMGGYEYSGKPALDPGPTNLQSSDPRRSAINREVWDELAGEGSGASINTYDNQRAIVTWGRGFAAKGELPEAMSRLFAADPAVRDLLLDVGFTLQGGQWLAVDASTGQVRSGDDALNLVRGDRKVLSRLIDIAEDPAHAQKWTDAQAATMLRHAGAVPEAAAGWPDPVIRFAAHCVHWGGLSWSDALAANGDLKAIIQMQAEHVPATDPWIGGSRLVSSQSTTTFLSMAGGIARDVLGNPAPAPPVDGADPAALSGHVFFDAGNNQVFDLSP